MSNFRDRLAKQLQENDSDESENKGEAEHYETFESSPFFGVENVRNAPACLDLRLKNYVSKAIPYSFILEISFDPSDGIEIISTTKRITVLGRNLKLLYSYLTAFRIKYIQANLGNDLTDDKALFVKDIKIDEI